MDSKRNIALLLFEDFLEEIRLTKGVDTYVRIQRLMNSWQSSDDPIKDLQRLKVKLSTLLSHSPEEQRDFYQRFDAYLERHTYLPSRKPSPPPSSTPEWISWLFILGISLLILAGVIALIRQPKGSFQKLEVIHLQQDDSQTIWFEDQSMPYAMPPFVKDSIVSRTWDFGDGSDQEQTEQKIISHTYKKPGTYTLTLQIESLNGKSTLTQKLNVINPTGTSLTISGIEEGSLPQQLSILKRNAIIGPSYEFLSDSMEASYFSRYGQLEKELYLHLDWGDGKRKDTVLKDWVFPLQFSHNYGGFEDYRATVILTYYWKEKEGMLPVDSFTLKDTLSQAFSIEDNSPYEPIQVPEIAFVQEDISDLVERPEPNNLPEIFFGLAFCLFAAYEWWKWQRRKPILDTSEEIQDPDWQPLKLDRPAVNLFRSEPFERWALSLRKQKHTEREDLDLPATLKDTLKKGGFPSLLFKPGQQSSQYLFLIERYGIHDQQAIYYQEFIQELEQRDISIEVWFFIPAGNLWPFTEIL